jgi:hypothetical protein
MKKFYFFSFLMLFGAGSLFAQADFNTGAMEVIVNGYGRIRLFTPDDVRHLQRASILVGTGETAVFDYTNDAEEHEPTVLVEPPLWGDFEIYGSYDNTYSNLPPNVIVKLNAYGWTNKAFTVLKFNVTNTDAAAVDAIIGLDIIPEIQGEYGFDTTTYNSTTNVTRFHRGAGVTMGMKLLSAGLTSLQSFEWFDDYTADAYYWGKMTAGALMPQYISTTFDGPVTVTAQAPITLAPGQSVDVYYAFSLGADEAAMMTALAEAEQKYFDLFTSLTDLNADKNALRLGNNVPNPFAGTTKISFHLPTDGLVSLKVYNQMGSEVATLVNRDMLKGNHSIDFNATGLAKGVYFYTLNANGQLLSNRMVITE